MSISIKFGQIAGPEVRMNMPCSASIVFKNNSAHFVTIDASGNVVLAATNATGVIGYAESGARTTDSTAAVDYVAVNVSTDAVYEVPACDAGSAVTEAALISAIGHTCDIYTSSNSQYADLAASGSDALLVVGYNYYGAALGQQTVKVKLNPYGISGLTGV